MKWKQFQHGAKLNDDLLSSFRRKIKNVADHQFLIIKFENDMKRNDDDVVSSFNIQEFVSKNCGHFDDDHTLSDCFFKILSTFVSHMFKTSQKQNLLFFFNSGLRRIAKPKPDQRTFPKCWRQNGG